jgi:hypothetical protein
VDTDNLGPEISVPCEVQANDLGARGCCHPQACPRVLVLSLRDSEYNNNPYQKNGFSSNSEKWNVRISRDFSISSSRTLRYDGMGAGEELLGIWNEDWGRVLNVRTDTSLLYRLARVRRFVHSIPVGRLLDSVSFRIRLRVIQGVNLSQHESVTLRSLLRSIPLH